MITASSEASGTLKIKGVLWQKSFDQLGLAWDRNGFVVSVRADNVEAVERLLAALKAQQDTAATEVLNSVKNKWRMFLDPADDAAPDGWVRVQWPYEATWYSDPEHTRWYELRQAIEDMPGRDVCSAGERNLRAMHFPLIGVSAARTYEMIDKYRLDAAPGVKAALERVGLEWEANEAGSYALAADGSLVLPGRFQTDAWDYQRAGIATMLARKKVLLADDTGLGKTVQSLGTLEAAGAYPALIVCKAGMRFQWRDQVEAWTPGHKVWVISGGDVVLNTMGAALADIIIISYALLDKYGDLIAILKERGLKSIVVDESHNIKNRDTITGRAVFRAAQGVDYRLLLTATPTPNGIDELDAQIGVLGEGAWRALGGSAYFRARFGAHLRGRIEPWKIDDLNKLLRGSVMIRREKSQVSAQLPELVYEERLVELSNREEYEAAEQDFVNWHLVHKSSDKEFQQGIKGLPKKAQEELWQQRLAAEDGKKGLTSHPLGRLARLRHIAGIGKAEAAIEAAEESDEKTLVFGHHKDVLANVAAGLGCPIIAGGESETYKDEAKKAFMTDPDVTRLSVSITSGGEGLDLQAATRVILAEKDWVPARETQAVGRAHRPGNKADKVSVVVLTAERTVDADVQKVLNRKRPAIERLLGSNSDAPVSEDTLAEEVVNELRSRRAFTYKMTYVTGGDA